MSLIKVGKEFKIPAQDAPPLVIAKAKRPLKKSELSSLMSMRPRRHDRSQWLLFQLADGTYIAGCTPQGDVLNQLVNAGPEPTNR